MTIEEFFNLFLEELKCNPNFHYYYKFLEKRRFEYRKAYFVQRLEFILNNAGSLDNKIWDCGCGFGTSALFLALNGYNVYGTTTEHYFKDIEGRLEYWSNYGNLDKIKFKYQSLFQQNIEYEKYDRIIVQDTLHHLEPIDQALKLLRDSLTKNGQLIVVEENGLNVIQAFKDYLARGNKRVIEIYDEHLKRNVLLGNENTRKLNEWIKIITDSGLKIDEKTIEYIRVLPPWVFTSSNMYDLINKEKLIWRQNSFLKNYFYFGINFRADKV